ncbi:MAG: Ribonuclease R [Opitutia bacterium UBA7350]|nr:MAG: Ribonuclease R [Opitutae bacterium UBA7350]
MDLRKKIYALIKAPDYLPLRQEEIIAVLKLNKDAARRTRKILQGLLDSGEIARIKKDRLCLTNDANLISGRIQFRQSGSAVLIPDADAGKKGIQGHPVNAEDTGVALHGDHVLARIQEGRQRGYYRGRRRERNFRNPGKPDQNEKPNVRVIRILKRARDTVVGNLKKGRHTFYVIPDDPRIIQDFLVPDPRNSGLKPLPKVGDKVVLKLIDWTQRHLNPEGDIIEVLGKTHAPDAEFKGILHKYELNPNFPSAVLKQTETIPEHVRASDCKGRQDCRDLLTFTIDPDDAKDFDDALSIEELEGARYRIGIHIADVSAYVKPGTPLDIEAQKRGNSTYLVGTVIPMLPHALSNGLCSLVEAEDRLTKSVFITYTSKAQIEAVDFANTVIRSNKRLTYRQAFAFMEKDDLKAIRKTPLPPKHQTGSTGRPLSELDDPEMETLQRHTRSLWQIARQLRQRRFKNGSLDLDMTEIKIYVDPQGYADRIEKQVNDESHQLIEEFMLSANEQVARQMKRNQFPCLYRVHDEPEEEKLQELRQTMVSFGITCGNLTRSHEMSALLKQLKEHPQGYTLKTHVLRSLKQAQYRASPDGHYGLSKSDYTHFTSPIRRYSDLIVHRIFDSFLCKTGAASAPKKPDTQYPQAKLDALGEHLCITERNSVDAERESVKTKLLEFYERELDKDDKQSFGAVITDIKNHGLYIEITDTMAFGMVHISTLDDDFYHLSEDGSRMVGRRKKKTYRVAQNIHVQVERVDRFKRQIDFRIMDEPNKAKATSAKKKQATTAASAKELGAIRKKRRNNRSKKLS